MAPPAELSFEEILKFMLEHNGRVTNHELVKHFKVFLMNPDMRDEARSTFKKHVNALAIIKNQNNEKWLILKKKYMVNDEKENEEPVIKSPKVAVNDSEDAQIQPAYEPPPPSQSTAREPSPIAFNAPAEMSEDSSEAEDIPPKIVPRRRSAEPKLQNDVTCASNVVTSPSPNSESAIHPDWSEPSLTSARSESDLPEEQKISVKERKQMFNRMASESDMLQSHKLSFNATSVDEEDRASLEHKESEPLDPQQKKWIVCAARGEYHALAKMCRENAKLARTKDPFTTAMHWACKRGDEDLVKLLAGVQRHIVNERSGYTPLHVATWFRRERVCRLLLEVYGADAEARDWAGKKPRQYLLHTDASLSPGSYRKKEGFLRIGSLNVRVKKTTEAFSNFLGVGAARTSAPPPAERRADHDRLKTWGSADNIQGGGGGGASGAAVMPPPSASKVRRRGASRRGPAPAPAPHSRSTPSTPDQPRAHIGASSADSDSDSAAGFHAAWRQQRAG